jgi:hypothetical protein
VNLSRQVLTWLDAPSRVYLTTTQSCSVRRGGFSSFKWEDLGSGIAWGTGFDRASDRDSPVAVPAWQQCKPFCGPFCASRQAAVDFEVDSVSSFFKAWLVATLLIVGYAWVDLRFNPHLTYETSFTLTPDVTRLSDLWDWGGRLLHHGAVGLLALNAIALGGIAAIVVRGALSIVRRLKTPIDPVRVSIVPASVPTSVPPPP